MDQNEIPIASDHAGLQLKTALVRALREMGYTALDMGTRSEESVDYPDFGRLVAQKISKGECARGILICGTGIGISIVANKFRGVRAALCYSVDAARLSREHNDANVLVLGGRTMPETLAFEILRAWLETPFGKGRHDQRVKKIAEIEAENFSS